MSLMVQISGGMVPAELIKDNQHTIWVKLSRSRSIIKRHKRKHIIILVGMPIGYDEEY